MARFVAYIEGPEACDHSILGCGSLLEEFDAEDWRDAGLQVARRLFPEMHDDPESEEAENTLGINADEAAREIEKITLYAVEARLEVDLPSLFAELKQRKAAREEAQNLAARRAQYERLKREFGEEKTP